MRGLCLAFSALSVAAVGAPHPQEVVPQTEAQDIHEITTIIEASVRAQFRRDGLATRDAHAKHHGCVNATVRVRDRLRAGVENTPTAYERQEFLSSEALTFCENLSFTPWHTLPEHRPIGGIQCARMEIHQTISKVRHELNQQPRKEP